MVRSNERIGDTAWESILRDRGLELTPEESEALRSRFEGLREDVKALRSYPKTREPFAVPPPQRKG